MKTPFEILAVAETADDEQVKAAYLQKIRAFPPERFPEKFKMIRAAFEQIRSRQARVAYRLFDFDEPSFANFLSALQLAPERRMAAERLQELIVQAVREHLKSGPHRNEG